MKNTLEVFKKQKEFLICVDSDGCAMDTMDVKHRECFGPKLIEVWGLQEHQEIFMEIWERINLYSRTRGINRFKGLVMSLEEMAKRGMEIPDFSAIRQWTENSPELSNPALEKAIEETSDEQLKKALEWSKAVNKAIHELPADDKPFPKAKEALEILSAVADIAIVSSANSSAVCDEWTRHGLAPYVQVSLGQEAGTKAACINKLKTNNYSEDKVLMVGDAPGDLDAASRNGVLYYPILVGKEAFSWERLASEALKKFMAGSYRGEYQQMLIAEFNEILK